MERSHSAVSFAEMSAKAPGNSSPAKPTKLCGEHQVSRLQYSREPSYFMHLTEDWDVERFPVLWIIGNPDLLKCELVALFCSRRCPGTIIRKSHSLAFELREKGTPVIGGFQTDVEKMCLDVLLKGSQPLVISPARQIESMRIPITYSGPVSDGRLLIVSPFPPKYRRPTKSTADIRNHFVVAAADKLFFLYAAPKSKTFCFAEQLLSQGKEIITFDTRENENLLSIGARHE